MGAMCWEGLRQTHWLHGILLGDVCVGGDVSGSAVSVSVSVCVV